MSLSILDIRARRARYADIPAQRIAPLRRTSDAKNAVIPRTRTLWERGMFSKRAGLAQFARVVSLVTRQQREPSFSSLSDSELRESRDFNRREEVKKLSWFGIGWPKAAYGIIVTFQVGTPKANTPAVIKTLSFLSRFVHN